MHTEGANRGCPHGNALGFFGRPILCPYCEQHFGDPLGVKWLTPPESEKGSVLLRRQQKALRPIHREESGRVGVCARIVVCQRGCSCEKRKKRSRRGASVSEGWGAFAGELARMLAIDLINHLLLLGLMAEKPQTRCTTRGGVPLPQHLHIPNPSLRPPNFAGWGGFRSPLS
jgi:hypothetical protein